MRWKLIGSAGPDCARRTRELLISFFPWAGEGIDLPTLMHRDLRDNVGGASEAIDPEVSGFLDRTCHHQRPVADQARAEKRSRLHVAIKLMQRKTERRLCHGVFGVATVDRVSGEPGVVTEVFPVRLAIH